MLQLLLCLSAVGVIIASEVQLQEPELKFATPCTTPNYDIGICVEVRKCSIFISSIASGRTENHDFIRASRCGPQNEDYTQPKVCCGKYDDYLSAIDALTTESATPSSKKENIQSQNTSRSPFPEICGNQTIPIINQRIVGGKLATIGEFPWMVRLRHRRQDGVFSYGCSGFLISSRFVLTAAHCIRSAALAPLGPIWGVLLGEHDTRTNPDCVLSGRQTLCADPPLLVRSAKPIVHAEYGSNANHHNDIALIPLKENVQFTRWIHPICLAEEPASENEMWLSGWGKTDFLESSPVKLKVAVTRQTRKSCANVYRTVEVSIIHSQLCAGGEAGKDSCTGDSGGPLMVKHGEQSWKAEGIVSFGLGCGIEDWPGIYTNIPTYYQWIKKKAKHYLNKRTIGMDGVEISN